MGANTPHGGTRPWQYPSPEAWQAWGTALGAGKGSSTTSFLTEADPLLRERSPKAVFELQGAEAGTQAPQCHPGQHSLPSKSISQYLITGETHWHGFLLRATLDLRCSCHSSITSQHLLFPLCCICVSANLPQKAETESDNDAA